MVYSIFPSSLQILSPPPNKHKGILYKCMGITCFKLENLTPYNFCLTTDDKDNRHMNDEFDP